MTDKLKALVHYVCHRTSNDPASLGLTKLNKVLWYSDVWMFKRRGTPITQARYVKQPWGPAAKTLSRVLADLQRANLVVQRREKRPGGAYVMLFSTQDPDLSAFTADEIATVDTLIDIICYEHGNKAFGDLASDLTWQMHEIGEEMPLYRSHVMELGQVTDRDIAWARQEAKAPL
jgi:hypothetical protein